MVLSSWHGHCESTPGLDQANGLEPEIRYVVSTCTFAIYYYLTRRLILR